MTDLQGYGVDTWCTDSLQPGRYARSGVLVAQAIYRRLITPRGTLQPINDGQGGHEESVYGYDVAGLVGSVGYPTALQALPGIVRGEILKDDRVDPGSLNVSAVFSTDPSDGALSITLSITGSLADESGTFALTLAITDVTVAILGGLK